jgi:hypothetical protein
MTQVKVIEGGNYKRKMHFCNWILQAVYDCVRDPKLTFFPTYGNPYAADQYAIYKSFLLQLQHSKYKGAKNTFGNCLYFGMDDPPQSGSVMSMILPHIQKS